MEKKTSGIRWMQVLLAGLLTEVATIGVIVLGMTFYNFPQENLQTETQQQEAERVIFYFAPVAGALMTFIFALWVGRRIKSRFVLHGTLVGGIAVLLSFGFLFLAEPEWRMMYVFSFLLKLLAGYLGGVTARRLFSNLQKTFPET